MGEEAAIGYSVTGEKEGFNDFQNNGFSRLAQVDSIACTNTDQNRPWTNVVYWIGTTVNQLQVERGICLEGVRNVQQQGEVDVSFLSTLLHCPCSASQTFRDRRFSFFGFVGENICFINRFFFTDGSPNFYGFRCCYNTK